MFYFSLRILCITQRERGAARDDDDDNDALVSHPRPVFRTNYGIDDILFLLPIQVVGLIRFKGRLLTFLSILSVTLERKVFFSFFFLSILGHQAN